MNKINLKIENDNKDIIPLVNLMNGIKAKMNYNLSNQTITFSGDSDFYPVIETISKNYSIKEIEIDNRELASKNEKEVISQTSNDLKQSNLDDILESHFSKMKDICYSYLSRGASSDEIIKYITTCYTNIYLNNNSISDSLKNNLKVGDIVDCNFGQNLQEEINGGHVSAIIVRLDFDTNIAFVSPIVKKAKMSKNIIHLLPENYSITKNWESPYILLEKSRYISLKRVRQIIGKVNASTFNEIVEQLPEAFSFEPILDDSAIVKEK